MDIYIYTHTKLFSSLTITEVYLCESGLKTWGLGQNTQCACRSSLKNCTVQYQSLLSSQLHPVSLISPSPRNLLAVLVLACSWGKWLQVYVDDELLYAGFHWLVWRVHFECLDQFHVSVYSNKFVNSHNSNVRVVQTEWVCNVIFNLPALHCGHW